MEFRNISGWAIRNPLPSIVLFVALLLAGLISFARMDVNDEPDIDFPIAIVVINQPGAAPTELNTQVTRRVEAAVRSIPGVDEITSQISEGSSITVVQLAIGTPIDRGVNDIRDAVAQIRGDLPDGILEPQIVRANTTDRDLASYSAVATDMTVEQLSWYIDNTVGKELLSVPGLAKVQRVGGASREIRIQLDPLKLQSHGLTAGEVNQQIQMVNVDEAGGRLQIAGSEQSVRVLGGADSALALGQTSIVVGQDRAVRLGDLGEVRDLYAEQRSLASVDGRQTVSFDIQRAKGASDVAVHHEAAKRLAALELRNPNVRFVLRQTSVEYTERQYQGALFAMIEGAVLAVVVVFAFLRDWRATVVSALAIPLSAIPTFWLMDLLGFNLNFMTLLALSLVAGVLVDDAIVEIENIVRHMRMGKSAYQASIDAADEIGLAVVATTMAIVAVFLPVGLMTGFAGPYFRNFGLTVVAAVLMSLAVARLITPMAAAYFLKSAGSVSHGGGRAIAGYMALLRWSLETRGADRARARGGWRRLTARFRDHRMWIVGLGFLTLALTGVMFASLPQTFQPAKDNDTSEVSVQLYPGATLAETDRTVHALWRILADQPEVGSVYSRTFVGNARVTVTLKPERNTTSTEFERALAPRLAEIPDARVSFASQFGWGDSGRDVTVVLGGDDVDTLNRAARTVLAQMASLPSLQSPRIVDDIRRPELIIRPRFNLAASLGVTTGALSDAIRVATLGEIDQNSGRFSLSDRQIPIRVMFSNSARRRLSTISNLPVPTAEGRSVPLALVAEIALGDGETKIQRLNQQRQVTLGADLAPGMIPGDAQEQVSGLHAMKNLPSGVSEMSVGSARFQIDMVKSFLIAVLSGIFLVFAVLVLLYRRLLPPLVNMGALSLAPLGGLIALWLAGQPVSMPVYIGLLMLLGIVAKNSILLVDFALEEINRGVTTAQAILDAGHKRVQPIVMTTVAMVAGMIPTALSLTGDGSFNTPMGLTVIGGLVLSTLLTLVMVPAAFSLAVGVEQRLGARLSRRMSSHHVHCDKLSAMGHAAV